MSILGMAAPSLRLNYVSGRSNSSRSSAILASMTWSTEMSSAAIDNPPRSLPWFLIVEGLLVVALGVAAVVFPVMAGVAAAVLFGWILIAVGAVGLVGAFSSRPRVHFGWSLVSA